MAMVKIPGPYRRKVKSRRNSECSGALDQLDWGNWWTDGVDDKLFLHVGHMDGDSSHRVLCRKTGTPRLEMVDGILYWLIDRGDER